MPELSVAVQARRLRAQAIRDGRLPVPPSFHFNPNNNRNYDASAPQPFSQNSNRSETMPHLPDLLSDETVLRRILRRESSEPATAAVHGSGPSRLIALAVTDSLSVQREEHDDSAIRIIAPPKFQNKQEKSAPASASAGRQEQQQHQQQQQQQYQQQYQQQQAAYQQQAYYNNYENSHMNHKKPQAQQNDMMIVPVDMMASANSNYLEMDGNKPTNNNVISPQNFAAPNGDNNFAGKPAGFGFPTSASLSNLSACVAPSSNNFAGKHPRSTSPCSASSAASSTPPSQSNLSEFQVSPCSITSSDSSASSKNMNNKCVTSSSSSTSLSSLSGTSPSSIIDMLPSCNNMSQVVSSNNNSMAVDGELMNKMRMVDLGENALHQRRKQARR